MADSIENKSANVKAYFKGVKSEWGKITWPSKQQVVTETIYVIIVTTIYTVMILVLDLFFKWVIGFLPKM